MRLCQGEEELSELIKATQPYWLKNEALLGTAGWAYIMGRRRAIILSVGFLMTTAVFLGSVLRIWVTILTPATLGKEMLLVNGGGGSTKVLVVVSGPPEVHHMLHYAEHLAWLNAVGGMRAADRHSNG